MKYLKFVTAALLIATSFSSAHTQEKFELENSVLWKVEHSEIEKPSYIFGTLHFMCESDFKIPEKITRTMQDIDALVLEVNLTDPEEVKIMQESMINQMLISEELSEYQFIELDKLVTHVMGAPLSNFDAYGLSVLNFLMISKMLPCTQIKSLETELTMIAAKNKIAISSLETVTEQMEAIKKAYPTDFTFEQLMLFESYKKDFNDAILSYNNEEITTAVSLITKSKYMDENAIEHVQIKRNANWIGTMKKMMSDRSNLFAVGAAHLTEEYGIINLLRSEGYTVTPVFK